jgi:hypothetical protein
MEKEEPRSIQILTIQEKNNRGGSSVRAVEECTISLVGATVNLKLIMKTNGSKLQTTINERKSETVPVTEGSTK